MTRRPPPVDRIVGARHPLQVGILLTLVAIAASQLAFGPSGSTVVLTMPHMSQVLFALLLGASATAALASAVARGKAGVLLEMSGLIGCSVTLLFYTHYLPEAVPSWNTTLGLGYAGIAIACAVRAGLVWRWRDEG